MELPCSTLSGLSPSLRRAHLRTPLVPVLPSRTHNAGLLSRGLFGCGYGRPVQFTEAARKHSQTPEDRSLSTAAIDTPKKRTIYGPIRLIMGVLSFIFKFMYTGVLLMTVLRWCGLEQQIRNAAEGILPVQNAVNFLYSPVGTSWPGQSISTQQAANHRRSTNKQAVATPQTYSTRHHPTDVERDCLAEIARDAARAGQPADISAGVQQPYTAVNELDSAPAKPAHTGIQSTVTADAQPSRSAIAAFVKGVFRLSWAVVDLPIRVVEYMLLGPHPLEPYMAKPAAMQKSVVSQQAQVVQGTGAATQTDVTKGTALAGEQSLEAAGTTPATTPGITGTAAEHSDASPASSTAIFHQGSLDTYKGDQPLYLVSDEAGRFMWVTEEAMQQMSKVESDHQLDTDASPEAASAMSFAALFAVVGTAFAIGTALGQVHSKHSGSRTVDKSASTKGGSGPGMVSDNVAAPHTQHVTDDKAATMLKCDLPPPKCDLPLKCDVPPPKCVLPPPKCDMPPKCDLPPPQCTLPPPKCDVPPPTFTRLTSTSGTAHTDVADSSGSTHDSESSPRSSGGAKTGSPSDQDDVQQLSNGRWVAFTGTGKNVHFLGIFETEKDARLAHHEATLRKDSVAHATVASYPEAWAVPEEDSDKDMQQRLDALEQRVRMDVALEQSTSTESAVSVNDSQSSIDVEADNSMSPAAEDFPSLHTWEADSADESGILSDAGSDELKTSKYKGVNWCAERQKWRASGEFLEGLPFEKYCESEKDAAIARDKVMLYWYAQGEYDGVLDLNFPRRFPWLEGYEKLRQLMDYRGVNINTAHWPYKWGASITFCGQEHLLGCFKSAEEAALAHDFATVILAEKGDAECKRLIDNQDLNYKRNWALKRGSSQWMPPSGKYHGVYQGLSSNQWVALYKSWEKVDFVGIFKTEEEAAEAYHAALVAADAKGDTYANMVLYAHDKVWRPPGLSSFDVEADKHMSPAAEAFPSLHTWEADSADESGILSSRRDSGSKTNSNYKGVSWCSRRQKWRASGECLKGVPFNKYCVSEEDAAATRDKVVLYWYAQGKYEGELDLNFPMVRYGRYREWGHSWPPRKQRLVMTYKGVSPDRLNIPGWEWKATVISGGTKVDIGYFATAEEAALAFDLTTVILAEQGDAECKRVVKVRALNYKRNWAAKRGSSLWMRPSSKYVGVYQGLSSSQWVALYKSSNNVQFKGIYKTEEEAAEAYYKALDLAASQGDWHAQHVLNGANVWKPSVGSYSWWRYQADSSKEEQQLRTEQEPEGKEIVPASAKEEAKINDHVEAADSEHMETVALTNEHSAAVDDIAISIDPATIAVEDSALEANKPIDTNPVSQLDVTAAESAAQPAVASSALAVVPAKQSVSKVLAELQQRGLEVTRMRIRRCNSTTSLPLPSALLASNESTTVDTTATTAAASDNDIVQEERWAFRENIPWLVCEPEDMLERLNSQSSATGNHVAADTTLAASDAAFASVKDAVHLTEYPKLLVAPNYPKLLEKPAEIVLIPDAAVEAASTATTAAAQPPTDNATMALPDIADQQDPALNIEDLKGVSLGLGEAAGAVEADNVADTGIVPKVDTPVDETTEPVVEPVAASAVLALASKDLEHKRVADKLRLTIQTFQQQRTLMQDRFVTKTTITIAESAPTSPATGPAAVENVADAGKSLERLSQLQETMLRFSKQMDTDKLLQEANDVPVTTPATDAEQKPAKASDVEASATVEPAQPANEHLAAMLQLQETSKRFKQQLEREKQKLVADAVALTPEVVKGNDNAAAVTPAAVKPASENLLALAQLRETSQRFKQQLEKEQKEQEKVVADTIAKAFEAVKENSKAEGVAAASVEPAGSASGVHLAVMAQLQETSKRFKEQLEREQQKVVTYTVGKAFEAVKEQNEAAASETTTTPELAESASDHKAAMMQLQETSQRFKQQLERAKQIMADSTKQTIEVSTEVATAGSAKMLVPTDPANEHLAAVKQLQEYTERFKQQLEQVRQAVVVDAVAEAPKVSKENGHADEAIATSSEPSGSASKHIAAPAQLQEAGQHLESERQEPMAEAAKATEAIKENSNAASHTVATAKSTESASENLAAVPQVQNISDCFKQQLESQMTDVGAEAPEPVQKPGDTDAQAVVTAEMPAKPVVDRIAEVAQRYEAVQRMSNNKAAMVSRIFAARSRAYLAATSRLNEAAIANHLARASPQTTTPADVAAAQPDAPPAESAPVTDQTSLEPAMEPAQGEQTPLHKAALNGHAAVIQLLRENGASVNVADKEEQTALHNAALKGHAAVVQVLRENDESDATDKETVADIGSNVSDSDTIDSAPNEAADVPSTVDTASPPPSEDESDDGNDVRSHTPARTPAINANMDIATSLLRRKPRRVFQVSEKATKDTLDEILSNANDTKSAPPQDAQKSSAASPVDITSSVEITNKDASNKASEPVVGDSKSVTDAEIKQLSKVVTVQDAAGVSHALPVDDIQAIKDARTAHIQAVKARFMSAAKLYNRRPVPYSVLVELGYKPGEADKLLEDYPGLFTYVEQAITRMEQRKDTPLPGLNRAAFLKGLSSVIKQTEAYSGRANKQLNNQQAQDQADAAATSNTAQKNPDGKDIQSHPIEIEEADIRTPSPPPNPNPERFVIRDGLYEMPTSDVSVPATAAPEHDAGKETAAGVAGMPVKKQKVTVRAARSRKGSAARVDRAPDNKDMPVTLPPPPLPSKRGRPRRPKSPGPQA